VASAPPSRPAAISRRGRRWPAGALLAGAAGIGAGGSVAVRQYGGIANERHPRRTTEAVPTTAQTAARCKARLFAARYCCESARLMARQYCHIRRMN
jgi:hypothetical protein